MGNALRSWYEAILNLVFPRKIKCMLCENELFDQDPYSLCEECTHRMYWLSEDTCLRCGRFMGFHSTLTVCSDCSKEQRAFSRNVSVVYYDTLAKKLIYQLKYGDQRYTAYHIAEMMRDRIAEVPEFVRGVDGIIPVPIHKDRMKERGFNQSEWIGKHLAERLEIPLCSDLVIRSRYTEPQTGLKRQERLKNLKGAFAVTKESEILGKTYLLLDDVFTTGSTVQEVAKELILKGAYEVRSVTLAAAATRER